MTYQSGIERGIMGIALVLCLGILTAGLSADAKTTRVYSPTGYADESTDVDGNLVRRNTYKDDGTPVKAEELDPKTGETTEETDYEDGKPVKQTTKKPDGTKVSETSTVWNEDGSRTESTQSYDEDGSMGDRVDTTFRPDGKPEQIDRHGPGGGLEESTAYQYHEDGTVMLADRTRFDEEGGTEEAFVEYDENGNVIQEFGDIKGIKGLPKPNDPHTTTQVAADGTRTTVRYNPDGSIDVWIHDKYGNIRQLQFFQSGNYLGFPRFKTAEDIAVPAPPVTISLRSGPSLDDLRRIRGQFEANNSSAVFVPVSVPSADLGLAQSQQALAVVGSWPQQQAHESRRHVRSQANHASETYVPDSETYASASADQQASAIEAMARTSPALMPVAETPRETMGATALERPLFEGELGARANRFEVGSPTLQTESPSGSMLGGSSTRNRRVDRPLETLEGTAGVRSEGQGEFNSRVQKITTGPASSRVGAPLQ